MSTEQPVDAFAFLDTIKRYAPGTIRSVRADTKGDDGHLLDYGVAGHHQRSSDQHQSFDSFEPDAGLRQWAQEAVESGTSRAQIFRAMLEQGHAIETCSLALDGFLPKLKMEPVVDASLRERGDTPPSAFFAFANVDLTSNASARRLNDRRIQLYELPDLLGKTKCDDLIERLDKYFTKSTVIDQHITGVDTYRTSSTAYLNAIDPVLDQQVVAEIAHALGVDPRYAEGAQVQRYDPGQQYKVHADYFHPSSPTFKETLGDMGQRTWSCVIYLNDDFKGGETLFERLDQSVKPQKGKAVFWNNLTGLGTPNENTYHCGMPVIEGEKYIVTTWFREKPTSGEKKVSDRFIAEYEWACQTPCDINEHLEFLHELASQVDHVTEFGVRSGMSTRAFLAADVILRSYDLNLDEHVAELVSTARQEGRNVLYQQADALDLEIEQTELLFIDTWHCYEQLITELRRHAASVNRFLVFHDTQTFGTVAEHQVEGEQPLDGMPSVKRVLVGSNGLLPAIIHFMIETPGEWQFRAHRTFNNGLTVLERIDSPAG